MSSKSKGKKTKPRQAARRRRIPKSVRGGHGKGAQRAAGGSMPEKHDGLYHVHSVAEFDALLASGRPSVVDFWAPWCAPCRMMAPIFEAVARDYGDRINFVKVNVDEVKEPSIRYGIRGIPTMLGFVDGEVAARQVGLMREPQFRLMVKDLLPPEEPEGSEAVDAEPKAPPEAGPEAADEPGRGQEPGDDAAPDHPDHPEPRKRSFMEKLRGLFS